MALKVTLGFDSRAFFTKTLNPGLIYNPQWGKQTLPPAQPSGSTAVTVMIQKKAQLLPKLSILTSYKFVFSEDIGFSIFAHLKNCAVHNCTGSYRLEQNDSLLHSLLNLTETSQSQFSNCWTSTPYFAAVLREISSVKKILLHQDKKDGQVWHNIEYLKQKTAMELT